MGQQTTAILFGVKVPDGVDMSGEDGDSGLLGECRKAHAKEIKALEKSGKLERYEYADTRFVPAYEYEAEIVGFWVAAGASGKAGCPGLDDAVALDEVETTEPYAEAVKSARAKWDRFTKWASKRGVEFPPAKLFLTETEVA